MQAAVRYDFAIDATGRTTAIRAAAGGQAAYYSDDMAPSTRGNALRGRLTRTGCSVTYTPKRAPLTEARSATSYA